MQLTFLVWYVIMLQTKSEFMFPQRAYTDSASMIKWQRTWDEVLNLNLDLKSSSSFFFFFSEPIKGERGGGGSNKL